MRTHPGADAAGHDFRWEGLRLDHDVVNGVLVRQPGSGQPGVRALCPDMQYSMRTVVYDFEVTWMTPATPEGAGTKRRRRRLSTEIKESLRELSIQLSLLNHQVGVHVDLKHADLDCLDLINRHGPLSPSAVARRAGLHPATMTGILDRLERGGWIVRERDPVDRRAVAVRALRDRNAELFGLYSEMNTSMDKICAEYGENELEVLADFLRRTTNAGRSATDELAGDSAASSAS
jgi:DNA-binding MarR family transcriptional regulator